MRTLGTLGLALLLAAAAPAEDKKADKLDAKALEGTWTYVSGMKSGEKSAEDALKGTVTVTKDTFTLQSPMAKFVIAYKLDAEKSPATIDMEIKESPFGAGAKAEGIIAVKGDEVRICYVTADSGGKRPTKFESTKDNSAFLFVLKREKK
jgi:uncharacterized protein (TIGR03067 family)